MDTAGPMIAIGVGGIILGLSITAIFILWGARIAGIEKRTFGKAIVITILSLIASFVLTLTLSVVHEIGRELGYLASFLISAIIMMPIFSTTFGKAIVATVFAWILSIIVIGGVAFIGLTMVGGVALLS